MTVHVRPCITRPRGCAARTAFVGRLLAVLTGVLSWAWSTASSAQVGTTLSLYNDVRFRGYSLSEGRPALFVDLSYDGRSGFYASVSGSASLGARDRPRPLAVELTAGYTKRISPGLTLDIGIDHTDYARRSSIGPGKSYTAAYAGLSYKFLSSRVSLSPHYFGAGVMTAYGELNANVSPARLWGIDGHVGLLVSLHRGRGSDDAGSEHDWRVGITRSLGRVSLRAVWTGGGPSDDYYRDRVRSKNKLVFGLIYAL